MTLRQAGGILVVIAMASSSVFAQTATKQAAAATKSAPATMQKVAAPDASNTAAPATKAPATATIDINTATKEQLMAVKGIGEAYSAKIIAGRPYKSKDQLWRKKVLPKGVYDSVKEMLVAKQT